MAHLTTKAIDAAQAPAKLTDDTKLEGGSRLMLIVRPQRKTWVLRTQTSAGDSTATIGHYPEMSLREARLLADEIVTGKRADVRQKGGTLQELLETYAESLGERPSAKDVRRHARWLLGRDFSHPLASKPAHLVEATEIAELLREKVLKGCTTSVNRARSTLSAAYNHGAGHDLDPERPLGSPKFGIKVNPVALVPRKKKYEVERETVIEQDDLRAIWQELQALGPAGAFGRLELLTLQRSAQLARATVDGDTLVVIDTKGRQAKPKVNLLPITAAMKRELDAGALVVPGAGADARRSVLQPRGLRVTDFRRSAETYLSELHYSGEARGFLLSHGLERSPLVRKHYDMAQRLAQKSEMLEAWRQYATEPRPVKGQKASRSSAATRRNTR